MAALTFARRHRGRLLLRFDEHRDRGRIVPFRHPGPASRHYAVELHCEPCGIRRSPPMFSGGTYDSGGSNPDCRAFSGTAGSRLRRNHPATEPGAGATRRPRLRRHPEQPRVRRAAAPVPALRLPDERAVLRLVPDLRAARRVRAGLHEPPAVRLGERRAGARAARSSSRRSPSPSATCGSPAAGSTRRSPRSAPPPDCPRRSTHDASSRRVAGQPGAQHDRVRRVRARSRCTSCTG